MDDIYYRKQGFQSELEGLSQQIQQVNQAQQFRIARTNELRGAIMELDRLLDGYRPEPVPPSPTPPPEPAPPAAPPKPEEQKKGK